MMRMYTCALLIGYRDEKFRNLADSILERRNNAVHPVDFQALASWW